MKIDKWFHLYGRKDDIVFEEVPFEGLPSAQRKGKWIMHLDDLFPVESTMECNQCHKHQPCTIDDNYCPNCGADMRPDNAPLADDDSIYG